MGSVEYIQAGGGWINAIPLWVFLVESKDGEWTRDWSDVGVDICFEVSWRWYISAFVFWIEYNLRKNVFAGVVLKISSVSFRCSWLGPKMVEWKWHWSDVCFEVWCEWYMFIFELWISYDFFFHLLQMMGVFRFVEIFLIRCKDGRMWDLDLILVWMFLSWLDMGDIYFSVDYWYSYDLLDFCCQ